jgi:hypothetical protein
MKVLLDECVDRRFAREIKGHQVTTVPEAGWAALKNGELLALAEQAFDVFLTVDRNLPFQHEVSRLSIAIVVLRARSNRVADLRVLLPQLTAALDNVRSGEVTWVGENINR